MRPKGEKADLVQLESRVSFRANIVISSEVEKSIIWK